MLAGLTWQCSGMICMLLGMVVFFLATFALRPYLSNPGPSAEIAQTFGTILIAAGGLSWIVGLILCMTVPPEQSLRVFAIGGLLSSIYGAFTGLQVVELSVQLGGRFSRDLSVQLLPELGIGFISWALSVCFLGGIGRRFGDGRLAATAQHCLIFQIVAGSIYLMGSPLMQAFARANQSSTIWSVVMIAAVLTSLIISLLWFVKMLLKARKLIQMQLGIATAPARVRAEPEMEWETPTTRPIVRTTDEARPGGTGAAPSPPPRPAKGP